MSRFLNEHNFQAVALCSPLLHGRDPLYDTPTFAICRCFLPSRRALDFHWNPSGYVRQNIHLNEHAMNVLYYTLIQIPIEDRWYLIGSRHRAVAEQRISCVNVYFALSFACAPMRRPTYLLIVWRLSVSMPVVRAIFTYDRFSLFWHVQRIGK